ncbi:hypothetical protein L208DRAFT_1316543, partial [Tricholoma matsutake]
LAQLSLRLLEMTWEETVQPLLDDDVCSLTEAQVEGVSEGQHTMSWIWRSAGVRDSTLWLEWCKTCARAHCWQKECLLLEEEMWQVQALFMWDIKRWKTRADDMQSSSDGNQEGQAAYAHCQADIHESMLVHCKDVWVNT